MRSLMLSFAMVAATGLNAPIWARNADDTANETAMAIPRVGMPGAPGVALPLPLSAADAVLTRRIFALQRAGAFTDATRETNRLESDLLRGTILADRYLNTGYQADMAELSAWLVRFPDQPDAQKIRALKVSLAQSTKQPPPDTASLSSRLKRNQIGTLGSAARSLLVQNKDSAAFDAAQAALDGALPVAQVADSIFAGGVAAWRVRDLKGARRLFEAAWEASDTASLRAASAFWSARVAEKANDVAGHIFWLRRAAKETQTFYGPIARHALNPAAPCLPNPSDSKHVVTNADVDALMDTGPGRRGFALLQVGERDRAEAELRGLWLDSGQRPALAHSLILVAQAVGLNDFADQLRRDAEASEFAPGKFELPLLRPNGGFRMDPAFVYAVVRHESNFQPLAVSPVGARGLMQLMPATAISIGAIGDGQIDRLNDPATNLSIGQSYLIQLGDDPSVGDDLLRLIAAYGQGPTGMNRWADAIRDNGDPFIFLEAIPTAFMRQFIEDVLIFQWRYAAAMHLRASSLDDLAEGIYPRFTPIKAVPGGMRERPKMCP